MGWVYGAFGRLIGRCIYRVGRAGEVFGLGVTTLRGRNSLDDAFRGKRSSWNAFLGLTAAETSAEEDLGLVYVGYWKSPIVADRAIFSSHQLVLEPRPDARRGCIASRGLSNDAVPRWL